MSRKIADGFELSKQSWAALNQNRQLVMFPVISMIGMLFVTILFFVPGAVLVGSAASTESNTLWGAALVVTFIYYFIAYTIVIFSNTALVGATMKLIQGEPATVSDGLRIASARFGKILVYALISATIGVIAKGISQSGRSSNNIVVAILSAIVGGLLQGAWNLVVFFAIPVLVVENVGLMATFERSWHLFKQTWGEGFVGSATIGGISCLAYLAVLLISGAIIAAGISLGLLPVLILGIVVLVLGFTLISLLNGAVNGIFQASLYNFASNGDAGPFIDTALAREAFKA